MQNLATNKRFVNSINAQVNRSIVEWNDAAADKAAVRKKIRQIAGAFEPTDEEVNDIETDMNRERKFNTVSKLKQSLDNAQKANSRKFRARHKQTSGTFLNEVSQIVHYAKLDFEQVKEKGNAAQMAKKAKEKSSDKTRGESRQSAYWAVHNAKKLAFAAENDIAPAMLEVENVDFSPGRKI